jgi:hypothetical protein
MNGYKLILKGSLILLEPSLEKCNNHNKVVTGERQYCRALNKISRREETNPSCKILQYMPLKIQMHPLFEKQYMHPTAGKLVLNFF